MKIACPCGSIIADSSDYQQHKAYLIADQDYSASLDEPAEDDAARFEALWRLGKPVYECAQCGRLGIDDGAELSWFLPESRAPGGALGSSQGSAFKVHLRAHWRREARPPGELWWGGSGDTPGGYERYESLEALRKRYLEVRERLRGDQRLRDAFLSIDGEIVDREE